MATMANKSKSTTNDNRNIRALIDLTKSTRTLLTHFQSSLTPHRASHSPLPDPASAPSSSTTIPNPLQVVKATTTLLKSHTTTLSLLLLTSPLTPSALSKKIGDVSSSVLTALVAAASTPKPTFHNDELGDLMRAELKAQARRVLGGWSEVLALIIRFAERREGEGKEKGQDEGVSESERQDVLAATGVVWEACDALLKVCNDGVVELVVKKAEQWRGALMDAVNELKEWGEDVEDDEEEDGLVESDKEDEDGGFRDDDDIFGAANKLRKGDEELKVLLDTSVKKLKLVGMLYQALVKRRLKTFPNGPTPTSNGAASGTGNVSDPMAILDRLMALLKSIPESVDDLASAFYDLDGDEANKLLETCCGGAKKAAEAVKQSWDGKEDEFTAWSDKWLGALEGS
ncbi:hypothetical protein K469DRAFT_732525 [Zopfia rhizophila CBS 207.26]|uniref:Cyclin-D1-binding protein 1-like N-terminal domain-containing protein n=1 Tax=Zopfia rhizophila CBS 207.26 TaxID=1314779 RepID=A0A6A6EI49_9PEZI|nr:hypothetical protein K469DRAFT_732525 [Zopfia rhizophila CBS 207.26]